MGQKEPPRLGSTICYGQKLARKSHRDSAVRFVTAKRGPERASKTRQYDLLRPRVGQKEPPRLGSTICCGQTWARKSHQDSAVRFVTAKSWPERATKTRQYDLLRPEEKPPRLGSTICYGQTWARKSHQDSAVRFVTAKSGPERATKTRQYDLLRPSVGQKEPPRLGSTICYGQTWARKSHRDSAVRFVTAKSWPERATKTRQYDLLRPNVGQKEPPRLGSTICYGQELSRKSPERAKRWPEKATETRQYDLLRPNVGQKEPPRLGSTICYGQTWARKSHQDSAVRFVTAKSWPERADLLRPRPERATKTRQYDLLRPRVVPERATKTRLYDVLRPRVGQIKPPRLGSTICYGQTWARKSHQDSAVRFVTAKRGPERATETRQYDLSRPRVGQKESRRLGSTICYGQELARKSHQDSAVRFVTAKRGPERATKTRQYDLLRPRVGRKEPPYDLLRPNVGQKEPPRLGSTICCGQTWARKSHQDSAVRFVTAKSWQKKPPRLGSAICYGQEFGQKEPPRHGSTICCGQTCARKSHQDSAVRFVTAKSWPERATKTRQYDLLRPRVGQKEPPRLGSTILRPNVGQKEPPRLGSTICYGQEVARKSHQDSTVRFVTAKSWPERATKTRQYDLLWPRVVCYGQTWARKSHQDSTVRFVTAKSCPERATKTRQYDLLRPRVGQKEPPRLGSTMCYGQDLATKSHQDSAVRFVTAKRGPPRLGSTICYGQDLARKSHQDSAVRFVTAKTWPERAIKTRQYDLLRPRRGQKEPPRLGSTICYGQTWARKSHQDSAVRFVTAKTWPEKATKTGKKPPRLGSTICYSQMWARKSHQDSAVRIVTAKSWPERATKTRQYDLLRPRVVQKEPPRLGSTICYGQTWARKSHQDSAVRFVTAKSWPERATETRQYDLLRPRLGQKEPPRLGSTLCYCQELARKSHQDSAVRFVTAKSWPEKATKTRQYDLLRPNVGQKET